MEVNFWVFITLGWIVIPLFMVCILSCYCLFVLARLFAAPFKAMNDTYEIVEQIEKYHGK